MGNLDDVVDISEAFQKYDACTDKDVMKHMKQILRQKIQQLYKNIPNPKMFKTQPQEPIWNPSTNLKSIAHINKNLDDQSYSMSASENVDCKPELDDEQTRQIQNNSLTQTQNYRLKFRPSPFRPMVHHSFFQIFHPSSFQICRPSPFAITNCSAEFDKSTNYSINADLKNMIQRLTLTKLFIFIHFCFFCYQT